MKKEIKMTAMFSLTLLVMTMGSCSSDEVLPTTTNQEAEEWHTVKVKMNINKNEFDIGSTRAVSDGSGWESGDEIYLLFNGADGEIITGSAKYMASDSSWNLRYYGSLLRDKEAAVQAYFFDAFYVSDINITEEKIKITGTTGVYYDLSGSYIYPTGGNLNIAANLKPETSRIRFKGTPNTLIKVSGVKYFTSLERSTGEMAQTTDVIRLTVRNDGYTPYLYGEFESKASPIITVEHSNYVFLSDCSTSMFQKGQSGWMDIPTTDNSNGWATYSIVSSVKSEKNNLIIEKGKTKELMVTVLPDNAYKRLKWVSSDNSVATVDNTGKITAVKGGIATITATSYHGDKSASCSIIVEPEHIGIDLGLPSGTLWASCNLGATSLEDWGKYYSWGETEFKENSSNFNSSNYIGKSAQLLENDAAHTNWGDNWKLPSLNQCNELINECTWSWIEQNGKYGYKVTGVNNNSIFLPASGLNNATYKNVQGYYWSSSADDSSHPNFLWFNSSARKIRNDFEVYSGFSIRPVRTN